MSLPSVVLRCDGVCKSYGSFSERHVLHQVTFEVRRGDVLALVGPNGAGKTTLLHLIVGLLRPLRGRLEVFGSADVESQRGRMGYLPEKENYPPRLTGREYLTHMARLSGLAASKIEATVGGVLEQFTLVDSADRFLCHCSAGLLKRFGLAAALIGEPDLLILDEPVDNLDPQGQRLLPDLLKRFRNEGKTLILSTHHLESLRQYGDDLLVLCEGQVAYRGTLKDLQGEATGYRIEFEGSPEVLEAVLKELPPPCEPAPQGVWIPSLEGQLRRLVLQSALNLGLCPTRCQPVYADLGQRYEAILNRFRQRSSEA